jgi:tRNA-modifying protein YgfZ
MIAELTDRAVTGLSGADAQSFLQGLITNDAALPAPFYAALLTAQGKILFDFLVFPRDGGYLLDGAAARRDALIKRLTMYRLRAEVEIARRDDLKVYAGLDQTLPGGVPDPRLAELGSRAPLAAHPADAGPETYLNRRLALGVPEGADFGDGATFALDGGLDELHAISFAKGCYVGQELTARMKHRAKSGKRLLGVTAAAALTPGDAVTADGEVAGTIQAAYGTRGFALLKLERLQAGTFAAGGQAVHIARPGWLSS